jgi:hypothetical protein
MDAGGNVILTLTKHAVTTWTEVSRLRMISAAVFCEYNIFVYLQFV